MTNRFLIRERKKEQSTYLEFGKVPEVSLGEVTLHDG